MKTNRIHIAAVVLAMSVACVQGAEDDQDALVAKLKTIATSRNMREDAAAIIGKLDAEHFVPGMRNFAAGTHPRFKMIAIEALRNEMKKSRVPKDQLGTLAMEFLPIQNQPALELMFIGVAIECGAPAATDALKTRYVAARDDQIRFEVLSAMMSYHAPDWQKTAADFLCTNTNPELQALVVTRIPVDAVSIDQPDLVPLLKVLQIMLQDDTVSASVGDGRRICDAAAQTMKNCLPGFVWSLKPDQRNLLNSTDAKERDQYIAVLDKWFTANVDQLEKQWKSALEAEVSALLKQQGASQAELEISKANLSMLVRSDFGLQTALDSPDQLAFIKAEVKRWWNHGAVKPSDAVASAKVVEDRVKSRYAASTQPAGAK